ncbi:MAG: hypothetical protein JO015_18750 [Verrucomicrobia bacterium]|nr:hypothetical protein [Verrucomicrobiota bacterium]
MAALVAGCSMLAACTHVEHSTTVPIAGGSHIRLTMLGGTFAQAEDDRYVVTESGLTTFRRGGRNFVRWQFSIRVKQPTPLADIKIEEVSSTAPVVILEDRQPQLDHTYWTKLSSLVPANPQALPWLYNPETTLRIFRVTITDVGGHTAVLYQPANFNHKAKEAIRFQMGPEIPG